MTQLQKMMLEATQFRILRDVFRHDPAIGPDAAALMRDIFVAGGERSRPEPKTPRAVQKNHAPY
jgi:hypothetical protein